MKYLPSFGWKPYVLTVKGESFSVIDRSLLEDLPEEVEVYRTRSLVTKRKSDSFRQRTLLQRESSSSGRGAIRVQALRLLWVVRNLLLVPDAQLLWVPFSLIAALRIIRNHQIQAIFTTGGPFSTFLTGWVLKKMTRKPWIVDFRDAWVQFSFRKWESHFRNRLEFFMERRVLRKADKVITVSKPMIDYFEKAHPDVPLSKFEVIPNGFDSMDFQNISSISFSKFTICYTGQIRLDMYSPEYIFRALQQLFDQFGQLKNDVQIIFVGTFAQECRSLISKFGLEQIVKILDYLPHREAIRYQKSADLLLLLLSPSSEGEEIVTGKLFEYLYHGIPILALVSKKSQAAKLILRAKAGIVVLPCDVSGIKKAIFELYSQQRDGGLLAKTIDQSLLQQYNRIELTRRLAEQFDSIL